MTTESTEKDAKQRLHEDDLRLAAELHERGWTVTPPKGGEPVKADSLWYEVSATNKGRTAIVTLRRCRNCGEVKVLSNPCGFDHLAALMEFRDHALPPGVTSDE